MVKGANFCIVYAGCIYLNYAATTGTSYNTIILHKGLVHFNI